MITGAVEIVGALDVTGDLDVAGDFDLTGTAAVGSSLTVRSGGADIILSTNPTTDSFKISGDVITILGEIHTTAWFDYSEISTIIGWATPAGNIYIKKIGNLVFVAFWLTGTGDSVTASFTLPYTTSNTVAIYAPMGYAYDNGEVTSNILLKMLANSNIVHLYPTFQQANWGATGTFELRGQFWLEAQ